MQDANRRGFIKTVGAGTLAYAVSNGVAQESAASRINVGVIGTGGMGTGHVRALAKRKDVDVTWLCDVDTERVNIAADIVKDESKPRPTVIGDMRKLLDDPKVDAVFIATPDHWHTPAALLALAAGKHVYVEKPCSHNIHEGRLLVDAAKKSGKFVQVGTQSRSTECVRDGIQRVLDGAIGDVLVAKAWNSQKRSTIGKTQPSDPPGNLDYDNWVGPAPLVPYRKNLLHAVWRWWYDFGCGDIGNDGVHDIDVALWGLGVNAPPSGSAAGSTSVQHPERVSCLGGTYFFEDDMQFPDTQYAICEYPAAANGSRKQFIYEQRIWTPYVQDGYENGSAYYGTNGCLIMGHTVGWKLFGPRNKLLAERTGSADLGAHHTNFFNCIRGTEKSLNAPATVGHQAATIVHLANIAARLGRTLNFDPKSETITSDTEAQSLIARQYRSHWGAPTT
ncbi:MAG: Gfo/Idh/MocA family oxidoreductase [Planctomycetota bacterium]|nr:Gfo/Idh/MocA family oxidoreductase [Planctomycetota bacterium]